MDADKYLKLLTRQVHDFAARKDILKEYSDHISDLKAALMESGMSEYEAEEEAIRQMGDPVADGRKLNKIYRKFIDWDTLIFFLVSGIILTMVRLLRFPDSVPQFAANYAGAFFLAFGLFWSGMEKYWDYPLFYAFGRNWNGGGIVNAAFILAISAAFLSYSLKSALFWILTIVIVQAVLRAYITLLRFRRENSLLWVSGYAETDISYKGTGSFGGMKMKVESREGLIKKGTPIMIVSLNGFKPVVIQI